MTTRLQITPAPPADHAYAGSCPILVPRAVTFLGTNDQNYIPMQGILFPRSLHISIIVRILFRDRPKGDFAGA